MRKLDSVLRSLHLLLSEGHLTEAASATSFVNAWSLLVSKAADTARGIALLRALTDTPSSQTYAALLNYVFPDEKSVAAALEAKGWHGINPSSALKLLGDIGGSVQNLLYFTPDEASEHYAYLRTIDLPDKVTAAIIRFYPDWARAGATADAVARTRVSRLLWPFLRDLTDSEFSPD